METSIWIIGSTSKGRCAGVGRGDLQKCDYLIQGHPRGGAQECEGGFAKM